MTAAAVRAATRDDVPALLRLVRALAAFEREPDAVEATEVLLADALFGERAVAHAHVAEIDGAIAGMAVWFLNYSTWTGKPGLYLEDLYVEERFRGAGVGRVLMTALAREAVARDCARMDWSVLDWNEAAMAAYRALGAEAARGWQPWRLDGAALRKLAAS